MAAVALVALTGPAQAAGAPSSFDTAEYFASGSLAQVHADEAYALGYTGAGVTVALFDTGMDPTNPEFAGKSISGYDFRSHTGNVADLSGHGTHDAGTIAANRDGVGMHGIAYDANVMSFNILYSGSAVQTNTDFFAGLQMAIDSGVRIASNSWITFIERSGDPTYVDYVHDNLKNAVDHGMIFVFAAGNFGDSKPWDMADLPEFMPDLKKQWIAVVAVDANNRIADFSNRCGPDAAWCIAAPGVNIYSTVPTGKGVGPGGNYDYLSGTSMATPLVSGALALVQQAFPFMTSEQMVQTILTTATPLGDSAIYGRGLLNAGAAVRGPGSFDMKWKVDTAGYNAVWSNDIAGAGALVKSGRGILVLNGHDTYSGKTAIAGGALQIGDAAHPNASIASDVDVRAHGLLSGDGTINGNVVNRGGVLPGGSTGALKINGRYRQAGNGTLLVEVGPTSASKLVVAGTAALGGTLSLLYDSGDYLASSNTLLSAGKVVGNFNSIVDVGAPDLQHYYKLTSHAFTLTLQPADDVVVTSLATAAIDGEQRAAGELLSRAVADPHGSGVWSRADGQFDQYGADSSGKGFDASSAGFSVGADHVYDSGLKLGAAGGFSHLDLSQSGARTAGSTDVYRGALYAGYDFGSLTIAASASYGFNQFQTHRRFYSTSGMQASNSAFDGRIATAAVEAAKPLSVGALRLMPSFGMAYAHLDRDGAAETGSPAYDLSFASSSADSLRPFAEAELSAPYMTDEGTKIVPAMHIAYSREILSTDRTVQSSLVAGSNSLIAAGLSPSRDLVTLGGVVNVQVDDRLKIHFAVDGVLPVGNHASQTVSAGLDYRF